MVIGKLLYKIRLRGFMEPMYQEYRHTYGFYEKAVREHSEAVVELEIAMAKESAKRRLVEAYNTKVASMKKAIDRREEEEKLTHARSKR